MSAAAPVCLTCRASARSTSSPTPRSSKLDTVPKHLIVVGGSYIGLEFAQMYRRFGAEVTIIEKGPRLIAREDEDVSDTVQEILTDEGTVVRPSAACIGFKPHADGVAVDIDCTSGEPFAVGSHVLLAV